MYKEAEGAAIDRLLKMKKEAEKDQEKKKGIGYLKRMKARLEFKISTEASSLSQEKEIIRRINEINRELDEALASVRLERKAGFIVKDIEGFGKDIKEINDKITELDGRLDGLYANLRKMLGIMAAKQQHKEKPQRQKRPVQNDINLEDIAVIKKR